MKILTVVYNLEKGGTQRAAQTFAEAYHELGHDSRVLSLYELGTRYDEIKSFLQVWHKLSNNNLYKISEWNPDIVHIHSHGPQKEDIEKLLDAISGAKVVETNVFSIPSQWAEKIEISFQLSKWAHWLFNLRGGSRYQSAIVPYPVKCSSFKKVKAEKIRSFREKYQIPQDAFLIGRIGQAFSGKWSPMLIQVFNDISKNDSHYYLLIVNPPQNIIEMVEASPYKNRIIQISTIIGDQNLSIAYSAMDAMVHIAEQGESFGMVLAEAILCETPVITLSTPWNDNSQCEVVKNLVGGYVVNSSEGIKETINLLDCNIDRINFQDSGKTHIYNKYNYISVAQKVIDLCKKSYNSNNFNHLKILEILNNTFDRPKIITNIFIRLNNNRFRLLTKYSSAYDNWSNLFLRIIEKMVK